MTLSHSFPRPRHSKELPCDNTHKFCEQEVAELSNSITKKVKLTYSLVRDGRRTASPRLQYKPEIPALGGPPGSKAPESDTCQSLGGGASMQSTESENGVAVELGGNARFPQRKILRSSRKDSPSSSTLPRINISIRKRIPSSDQYHRQAVVPTQQQNSGQTQVHHNRQPPHEQLTPLVLSNSRYMAIDNKNISIYMQAKRLNISVAPKASTNKGTIRITARTVKH